jgi:hypothetical protein
VGHFHEAGLYRSGAEFRALIVPFAEEGIAAGEPVIIGYDDRKSRLVRSWLTDPSAVTFIDDKACTQPRPGRSPPTGGCLNLMSPWAPGKSGSPAPDSRRTGIAAHQLTHGTPLPWAGVGKPALGGRTGSRPAMEV